VTVTARSGQSKIGGTADPVFLYDITSGSLVNGDLFSGALSRMTGEAAGSYPILQGTLSLSSNYDLTYSGANFIITDPIVSNINNEKYPLKSQISPVLNVTQNVVLTGYPNPFSQKAIIEFTVPADEKQVFLDLFDLRGLKVAGLYKGKANANQLYRFTLDGTNIPPGAYFVRLTLPNQIENYKIIMLE
ncbi:MAG TPA: MBG domain-containing protein, partial [Sphingobacteriaceae bacterium]